MTTDVISQNKNIISFNNQIISSLIKNYLPLSSQMTGMAPVSIGTSLQKFERTEYKHVLAGGRVEAEVYNYLHTELPTVKVAQESFVFKATPKIITFNYDLAQTDNNYANVDAQIVKKLLEQWDIDAFKSIFLLNGGSVNYNAKINGIDINKLLSAASDLSYKLKDNLTISELSDVVIIVNQNIAKFLDQTITSGNKTNKELFESALGGIKYIVMSSAIEQSYKDISAQIDVNGRLVNSGDGLMIPVYAGNMRQWTGILPQKYQEGINQEKYYHWSHFVYHNSAIEVMLPNSIEVQVFNVT